MKNRNQRSKKLARFGAAFYIPRLEELFRRVVLAMAAFFRVVGGTEKTVRELPPYPTSQGENQ